MASIPTIHLNGTSARELQQQIADALNALDEAITKHTDAAPNGRDFYTQSPSAISVAQEAYIERCQKLRDVYDELLAIHVGIDEQVARRENQRGGR